MQTRPTRHGPAGFLRLVLYADAGSGLPYGLLLLAAGEPIARSLALPPPLLGSAGLFLLPFAAFLAWVATRREPPAAAVWLVIGVNLLWMAGSFALLARGEIAPNALGQALFSVQAVLAGLLGVLEYAGLRRVLAARSARAAA